MSNHSLNFPPYLRKKKKSKVIEKCIDAVAYDN